MVSKFATASRTSGSWLLEQKNANPGNFFMGDDYTFTLFTFDDCAYGHFIYDIAMVVIYAAIQEQGLLEFIAFFLQVFLVSYREENCLDPLWLKEIPYFLKLHKFDLFAAILFLIGETPADRWCARYMQGRRAKIESDVPFSEFDWESLVDYLKAFDP